MTTLLFLFVFVLIFSMDLTPAATWLGARLVAVDIPMERLPRLRQVSARASGERWIPLWER